MRSLHLEDANHANVVRLALWLGVDRALTDACTSEELRLLVSMYLEAA
jgi:hypothetical protein